MFCTSQGGALLSRGRTTLAASGIMRTFPPMAATADPIARARAWRAAASIASGMCETVLCVIAKLMLEWTGSCCQVPVGSAVCVVVLMFVLLGSCALTVGPGSRVP